MRLLPVPTPSTVKPRSSAEETSILGLVITWNGLRNDWSGQFAILHACTSTTCDPVPSPLPPPRVCLYVCTPLRAVTADAFPCTRSYSNPRVCVHVPIEFNCLSQSCFKSSMCSSVNEQKFIWKPSTYVSSMRKLWYCLASARLQHTHARNKLGET
jgi:hypothetical protein